MGDLNDFLVSDTTEHLVSTPPVVSDTAGVLLPRPNGRRNRSEAWKHFSAKSYLDKRARCNYYRILIKYDNRTSAMRTHLKRCKDNPDKDKNKRQKSVSSSTATADGHVVCSPLYAKFDQEACRNELVKMFMATELLFRFVENEAFRKYTNVLQPRFSIPSRTILARDIFTLWDTERTNLKKFLSQHFRKVCLTTDSWTSCQNMSYMCLTAHFINNNWELHKKILNFCHVTNHSGEIMAKTIEMHLSCWELNRVFSLTVDNASLNEVGIQHLKRRLASWNSLVVETDDDDFYCWNQILKSTRCKSNAKSELKKYLKEDLETNPDLDILSWWRLNSSRFPILANIARELLAIPVSTVVSESAFSTGRRVLDPYRSSLILKMVEALVCTQDCLHTRLAERNTLLIAF